MARTAKKVDAAETNHVEVATAPESAEKPLVEMVPPAPDEKGGWVPTINLDELRKTYPTKSAQIRFLFSKGLTRGQIAKALDIRYQHVRNVLITPLKSQSSSAAAPVPTSEQADTKTE